MKKNKHIPCPPMNIFAKGQERKEQVALLRDLFPNYKSSKHYWYVIQYNKEYADETMK